MASLLSLAAMLPALLLGRGGAPHDPRLARYEAALTAEAEGFASTAQTLSDLIEPGVCSSAFDSSVSRYLARVRPLQQKREAELVAAGRALSAKEKKALGADLQKKLDARHTQPLPSVERLRSFGARCPKEVARFKGLVKLDPPAATPADRPASRSRRHR